MNHRKFVLFVKALHKTVVTCTKYQLGRVMSFFIANPVKHQRRVCPGPYSGLARDGVIATKSDLLNFCGSRY